MDRDIFDEMRRMAEEMEQMFGSSSSCPTCQREGTSHTPQAGKREPIIEVQQTDTDVIVTAELPGMEKDDIDLQVRSDRVEIKAEKKGSPNMRVHQPPGYRKAVPLPVPVKSEGSTATCKNGVLEIILPKRKEMSEPEDIYIR
ncbi:MAG: Hsp20/alpha crystallin family protein [Candidatus Methanofastidiosia archaeon]|jgi:HSP20 family protein